eukprot:c23510_g2_i2 orf=230-3817(-)
MADQRRSSWPWRKLKSSSRTPKAGDKTTDLQSPSQLAFPASSFKAEGSTRFPENRRQETTTSTFAEDGRVAEAISLREKAEENLRALKQELNTVMKEMIAKEALVKQHQKVADEAVSGWEKAEKQGLSLKQELESAAQHRIILEDRVAQLDGALKECMRQVRHVRDEQQGKIQEAIACKTREWGEVKANMDARQEELQRRLMESDAQNSAMAKALQERARKIVEVNEAKSRAETELNVVQVKLGSAEKNISALQYELHLLSKELEIRNEEVAFCKKSADAAHKQHLDTVQKVAKLEADCQRLRSLVKKKLPGPAAIAQMRKEVEGLQGSEKTSTIVEVKRRPDKPSYASSTVSFTNSHQRGVASSINRDVEMLQDRLVSMDAENKLLKEALSKRIGELQASWLLCAKTANKLSIAEDHLESLQGTPREARTNGFDFNFTTTTEPSIASLSEFGGNDEEEASCAESWASALIGELAHFKKDKFTTNESIKQVSEPYNNQESSLEKPSVVHATQMALGDEKCPVNDRPLPDAEAEKAALEMGNTLTHQDVQLQALNLLCKDLDHKLGAIEEQLRSGKKLENEEFSALASSEVKESVIGLVDAAHQKFAELERVIQGMGSISMQSIPDQVVENAAASPSISETDRFSPGLAPTVSIIPTTTTFSEKEELGSCALMPIATSISEEHESKTSALPTEDAPVTACDSIPEDHKPELPSPSHASSLGFVLCKLIALLEMLPRKPGDASLDADCTGGKREEETERQWDQEKQALVACKDGILQGKSSVLEFLARLGVMVCRACHAGSGELENVLATLNAEVASQVHVDAAGFLTWASSMPRQRQEANKADELEEDVAGSTFQELEECKQVVTQLQCQLTELKREKEKLCEEREKICEEGATKAAKLEEAHAKLEEAQAELSHYKMLHTQLETKCEELHLKLQGFEMDNGVKLSDSEDSKLRKEGDLVEAKEKLAECERTIMVLGKQLNALSEPELKQTTSTMDHHRLAYSSLPRHHPVPQNEQAPSPRHQYRHQRPHYADLDEPPHQHDTDIYGFNGDVDRPPRQRGWGSRSHVASGPADTDQYRQFFPQSGSPAHVAQSQQMKARRQRYVDAGDWQQREEEAQLALTEQYSTPLSAMASPASSPACYMQQVSGRGTSGRATVVRTSLTESLNAAANVKPPTPGGAAAGSSFRRLFSGSKHHC